MIHTYIYKKQQSYIETFHFSKTAHQTLKLSDRRDIQERYGFTLIPILVHVSSYKSHLFVVPNFSTINSLAILLHNLRYVFPNVILII